MTRWTQRESVTLFTERSVRWVKRDRGVRMTRWLIDRSIPFSSVLMSVTVVVWWWLQEKTSETSQWSAVMGRGQANRWQFYSRTHKEGQKCVSVDGLFVNCEWSQGRCVESRQRWSANWSVKGRNDDPLVDGGGERDSLPWGESIVLSEWRVLMVDGELSWQLNEWSIESMVIE